MKQIPKKIEIGILDLEGLNVDKKIKDLIEERVRVVSDEQGWKTRKIKIENLDLAVETYYPLVYTEFFSSTRRFDGRRYGKKIEDAAGPEVLRRIFGGFEITKAEHKGRHYDLALKVKKFIEKEFFKKFKDVDCIISPTIPTLPWRIGEKISIEKGYAMDILTISSNLAGNCSISIPTENISGVPVGLQIICDKFEEQKLLQISNAFLS